MNSPYIFSESNENSGVILETHSIELAASVPADSAPGHTKMDAALGSLDQRTK